MQTSTSSDSSIRYSALSLGLLFLLLGLAGFVPAFVTRSENFTSEPGFGYIFGVFPTNYFHNAIGILVGVWGIAAFTSLSGAIVFNRIFAIAILNDYLCIGVLMDFGEIKFMFLGEKLKQKFDDLKRLT